jgi:hypothetical protein
MTESNVFNYKVANTKINDYGYGDKEYLENIIVNIDSRNRDLQLYPSETSFKINLDLKYKNIVTIGLNSIEMHNTNLVTLVDTTKNNNYILLYFPNRYQDYGYKLVLPTNYLHLYVNTNTATDYTNMATILNNLILNNINNLNQKYLFFYITNSTNITVTSNNYTYNYSVGTGIYTISGLCRLVSDWLIAIAVNNYSVQSFSLAIQAKSGTVTINYNQNNFTLPQDLSNYIMNLLTNQFTPYLYTDLYNIKFYP